MRHYEQGIPALLGKLLVDGTHKTIQERYAALNDKARFAKYDEFDDDVVVVDTETTGLSFVKDELIQIAAARVCGGKIVDWHVTFVDPEMTIPKETSQLTGITQKDINGAPKVQDALENLVEFVGDSYVVAHNIGFDKTFLTKYVQGYPLLENTWIDTLDLARIALPRLSSHRLKDMAEAFECPASTHRADADVEATCSILRILLAAVQSMPKSLVVKISKLTTREEWSTVAVFEYFASKIFSSSNAEENSDYFEEDISLIRKRSLDIMQNDAIQKNGLCESSKEKCKENLEDTPENKKQKGEDSTTKTNPHTSTSSTTATATRGGVLDSGSLDSGAPDDTIKEKMSFSSTNANYCRVDARKLRGDCAYKLKYPTEANIEDAFSADGCVGVLYEKYEQRNEQIQMSKTILNSIEHDKNLVVEAGTGVGKSMAYLVPLIRFAKLNNITVGVATKTNALLDQLVFNELPALATSMGGVKYAALKGQTNYICMRKASNAIGGGAKKRVLNDEVLSTAPAIASLASFIEQTEYDDADTFKVEYKLLSKREYTTTSSECLKHKCPFYKDGCYVFGARLKAKDVDIVITNHSMLFTDIRTDGKLLPPIRYWVIDEAHRTEEEARNAFAHTLSSYNIEHLKNQFASEDVRVNPFARAERVMSAKEDGNLSLFYSCVSRARAESKKFIVAVNDYVQQVKELLAFEEEGKGKPYETVQIWINKEIKQSSVYGLLRQKAAELRDASKRLMKSCQEISLYLDNESKEDNNVKNIQGKISSIAFQLSEMVGEVDVNFGVGGALEENPASKENTAPENGIAPEESAPADQNEESYVFAADLYRNKEKTNDEISARPINVGEVLNETLFENTYSVIFTSATLSTEKNFNAISDSLGLNTTKKSQTNFLMLNSSYDFDRNMKIYVPTDMPEPFSAGYLKALQDLLVKVHRAQGGSVLSLFTNRREMESCYDVLSEELEKDGLRVLCQKKGFSTKTIKDEFLKDKSVSLLALKSFWEGFDAPGDTLKSVVVSRLPFAKPNDPLMCERKERDPRAWFKYVLPASITEVKQAVGRLIRKADDKGSVILADKRIISKTYGSAFIDSLPSSNVAYLTVDEIAQDIEENNL